MVVFLNEFCRYLLLFEENIWDGHVLQLDLKMSFRASCMIAR